MLEHLDLNGSRWFTPDWFDDGEALFAVVVEQGLEGIVAKRRTSPYRSGERAWIKIRSRTSSLTRSLLWGMTARQQDQQRPPQAPASSPPEADDDGVSAPQPPLLRLVPEVVAVYALYRVCLSVAHADVMVDH